MGVEHSRANVEVRPTGGGGIGRRYNLKAR